MRAWIRKLGAIWISVVILIVLCIALAAGTLIESTSGAEAAKVVYDAGWFRALLAIFTVNNACALIDRYPWGKLRVGFAITHLSMVVILVGAWVTLQFKVEGHLPLYEGEVSSVFLSGEGAAEQQLPLGFSVALDDFELGRYPGTMRPSQFRSNVTVTPSGGAPFKAVIQMNQPLYYGGWSFFQSSYDMQSGREMTVLSVSKDPGQNIVFVGYGLLVLGMCWVAGTRIYTRRKIAAAQKAMAAAAVALLSLVGTMAASPAEATYMPAQDVADRLHRLPVQHDGRSMPLETMANEALNKITGPCLVYEKDPVRHVLGWLYDHQGWADLENVYVGGSDVARALGLAGTVQCASFNGLVNNPRLSVVLQEAEAAPDKGKPKMLRDAEELSKRLEMLSGFYDKSALRVMPIQDPMGKWQGPNSWKGPEVLLDLIANPPKGFAHYPTAEAIDRELLYNRARPARLAWLILVPAALLGALGLRRPRKAFDIVSALGLVAGFAAMSWGIWLRWQIAGRVPASNMYESMLFLAWGVGLFAMVASIFWRQRMVVFNAAAMSALTMLLIDLLPMDGFIHPVAPVLSGTVWLAIHVPIIMVSYSVLTLGVLVAHMQIGVTIFAKDGTELARKLYDLLYWYILIGSILLIAGILTGSIWAASSWGRYWGWDPKEVWSLIAFLAYMAILHGKFDRLIGAFGVAAFSIGAFWTILMTYLGVNYVLAAGMHSYGFGGSDVVTWMLISGAVELAFLAAGFARRKRLAI